MLERIIRSYIMANVFLMVSISVLGVIWLLEFFGFSSTKSVTYYNGRALVALMIMTNIAFWKAINYYRIYPKMSENVPEIVAIVCTLSVPLLFAFSSKVFCYLLLLMISIIYTLAISKEFILFAVLPLVKINYTSVLLILYTVYFLKDLFLIDSITRRLLYIDFAVILFAFLGSFFEIKEIIMVLVIVSIAIILRRLAEFIFKKQLFTRLLLLSLISLLLATMPISKEATSEKYAAMFHVLITCSYSLLFISFMIILGRRGLLIFPRGYENYVKFISIGILLMFLHALSFLFEQLFFCSFMALGVYGIVFMAVSKLYFEKYVRKSI